MATTYLIVGHRGARFAIEARAVREIVWLPRLSVIEEMPPHIIGAFNLRGRVLPVMDLGLRFGHGIDRHRAADSVVVIERDGARAGIRVHELHEVVGIGAEEFEAAGTHHGLGGQARFVSGQIKRDDGLVMLLDVGALLRDLPADDDLGSVDVDATQGEATAATDAEETLFLRRARDLARHQDDGGPVDGSTFALLRLGGELFGLDIGIVREFAHRRGLTPIPCCPPSVAGNMNLRGEILTVVDIRAALGLASDAAAGELAVLTVGGRRFGVLAEEIVDMVLVASEAVRPLPTASRGERDDCCIGVATVDGRTAGLLDMERVLASPAMRLE